MDSSLIGLFCPWNSPGRNTGVGCHFLLQGIFPIQSLNLALPHCRQTRYLLLLLLSCFSRVRLCATHRWQPTRLPVPGILQARTPEWVAISFSNARKWKVKVKSLSRVWLLATPWAAAYQAPPSMGFSRQEYWSGVPLPSPSVRMVIIKKTTKNKHWWRYWKKRIIVPYWWECKLVQPLWKTV